MAISNKLVIKFSNKVPAWHEEEAVSPIDWTVSGCGAAVRGPCFRGLTGRPRLCQRRPIGRDRTAWADRRSPCLLRWTDCADAGKRRCTEARRSRQCDGANTGCHGDVCGASRVDRRRLPTACGATIDWRRCSASPWQPKTGSPFDGADCGAPSCSASFLKEED